ncbi:Reverse transcriptase and recombinase [Operophtera brumata]|uniref:Reverse transcriptase and recombinase n=1 Tax=Operophtera brumata TaxID=104452 RepID=A0A0L7LNB5_OPEBR|nr:Reverse transcriptase and recombinase [Operophtera brumata]
MTLAVGEKQQSWLFASYRELSKLAYQNIVYTFGPSQIDLFTSRTNAKCKLFASWKQHLVAMAADAFKLDWNNYYFYTIPPFTLILKCIRKIIHYKANGILFLKSCFWGLVKTYYYLHSEKITLSTQTTYPGRREAQLAASIQRRSPASALELMLASLSDNTIQYSKLILWWQYCVEKDIEGPSEDVMSFIAQQFNNGASYGILGSHRLAILLLGDDDLIKRLLKGAYRLKPSAPMYSSTWDPQLVFDQIAKWVPHTVITTSQLTKKLVMLLAHRIQTFLHSKVDQTDIQSNGIKIIITNLIQTSGPGRKQPVLYLPRFRENINICPATALEDYLTKTKDIRHADNNLFFY